MMVHHIATYLHCLSAALYVTDETPESGKSSSSWCLVDSISHAGHSFAQLPRVDGDEWRSYHSHQDPYWVTIYVVLGFALARQLVQMPATAHSIPWTSELLLHGFLLWDLGRSRLHWIWSWIQRNFVNPGIWAAFVWVHHCQCLHTCVIYPHCPQNNLLATTSTDELGQEEDKISPHFVEEVQQGVHFRICLVLEVAPL